VIEHGVSGFVLEPGDEDGALEAIRQLGRLDRRQVRAAFERRFTARRMVDDYVRIYNSLLSSSTCGVALAHATLLSGAR
jgi:glycosyltransferase involved in cell wall biosynthesis